jgi:hypothetical protein
MYPIAKIKQDSKANVVDLKPPPSHTMMHIKNDTTKYEAIKYTSKKIEEALSSRGVAVPMGSDSEK